MATKRVPIFSIFAAEMRWTLAILVLFFLSGCNSARQAPVVSASEYASYFEVQDSIVKVISPYDSSVDTLWVSEPMDRIICMSSSSVAALEAIGAVDAVSAVSGLRYITDESIHERCVPDIGYENSLDYETVLSLNPDILVAYTVSGTEPPYLSKLRSLGIRVLVIHDHLEQHPLARAEYVRLFGALTGRLAAADSVFSAVRDRYESLASSVDHSEPVKVLMNIPYGDAWYIPGADSYMARLIRDAGGEVLGAEPGTSRSRVINMEQAYALSSDADMWLNPGHCRSIVELTESHHFFNRFGPVVKGQPVFNNTLRTTDGGGNDFWETGAVRPDLILEDLLSIFSESPADSLNYFFRLDQ